MCPVYDGCDVVGKPLPRDQAIDATNANARHHESFSCSTVSARPLDGLTFVGIAGFFGIAIVRSRRRG